MIFIDTSVWIYFFRGSDPNIVEKVRHFLDQDLVALASIVHLELISGAKLNEIQQLKRVLSALPTFYPQKGTWKRIEDWIEPGIKSGQRFGIADLLIASTTAEHQGELWSLDSDFKRMEKLGFVKCLHPDRTS